MEFTRNENYWDKDNVALDRDMLVLIANGGIGAPACGLIPRTCYVGNTNYREATPEPLLTVQSANPDPKALLIAGMEEARLGSDPAGLNVHFAYGGTSPQTPTIPRLSKQFPLRDAETSGIIIKC